MSAPAGNTACERGAEIFGNAARRAYAAARYRRARAPPGLRGWAGPLAAAEARERCFAGEARRLESARRRQEEREAAAVAL
eukprot:3769457-Alexandrium_andersonii.AAC.1